MVKRFLALPLLAALALFAVPAAGQTILAANLVGPVNQVAVFDAAVTGVDTAAVIITGSDITGQAIINGASVSQDHDTAALALNGQGGINQVAILDVAGTRVRTAAVIINDTNINGSAIINLATVDQNIDTSFGVVNAQAGVLQVAAGDLAATQVSTAAGLVINSSITGFSGINVASVGQGT